VASTLNADIALKKLNIPDISISRVQGFGDYVNVSIISIFDILIVNLYDV